jgi:hypothetical protein
MTWELNKPMKLNIKHILFCLLALCLCAPTLRAQTTPIPKTNSGASPLIAISNSDCTATDDLGRTLPTYAQVGPPKANHYVGLFYWQWHGPDRWGPDYNVTTFLKTHPGFWDFQAHPPGGPQDPTWYWAEPIYGYYRSDDPWVIRKQLVLFADAGVDFLFLDYTNGSVYDPELKTFLQAAKDLKAHGVAVPRIVFFLNSEPEWKIEKLYTEWYKPGKFDDMWFHWQGKPLIMAPMPTDASKFKNPALLPEIQRYFTWRPTWAFQDAAKEPTKWRFMDEFHNGKAQRPALSPDGKIEQYVVSKSLGGPLWNNMQTGGVSCAPGHVPVYNDQWVSPDDAKGIFFQAQWNNALKVNAPILLVTGWNEWTASVWEQPGVVFLGRKMIKGEGYIVDEFNADFDRDLEPMQGGYGDDYYGQFVANMRRYKGMTAPTQVSGPKTITVSSPLSAWNAVRPLYRDADHGIAPRNWDGATPNTHYANATARNSIVLAQVAHSTQTLAFHVRTAAPLTAPAGKAWMLLLVNTDGNPKTGWLGYDYLIDRRRSDGHCTVERNLGGGWHWQPVANASYAVHGRDLVIIVPRRALGLTDTRRVLNFDFKWVDNLPATPTAADFYTNGDVAPDARFAYIYQASGARQPRR